MGEAQEYVGPLSGVRIVELAGIGPSQHGGMLLGDLGADVVRVDRPVPGGGAEPEGGRRELLNRGRRSIALNLKDPDDLDVVWRLIDTADVLVDPYRPGVAERLGLSPEAVLERNPRIVFARMTGWGQDGPLALTAGHDVNYLAVAGALEPIGPADRVPPVPLNLIGDFGGGGMMLAFGIVTALLERERSGKGQTIDVAMIDGVASLMGGILDHRANGRWRDERGVNVEQGASPWYRAYRTADDKFVTVGTIEEKFYRGLLERLNLEPQDWPQWDQTRWPVLAAILEERFATRTRDEWEQEFAGLDVCFAPAVSVEEAPRHPHLAARGSYVERDGIVQPAPVPRFARTPGRLGSPPPWPGEHQEEIRRELG